VNLPSGLFPQPWLIAAFVGFGLLLAAALAGAPWRRLAGGAQASVWPASLVALALLWSMQAGVQPGLNLHMLGAMAMVLAFGPQIAFIGMSLVLVALTANGSGDWAALGLNALVMAALPCALAWAIFRAADRWLPNHLFVYVFANAFFGSALTLASVGLGAAALLAAAGAYSVEHLTTQYLPYFLLVGFSEAWLSGMVVTLMVVWRPGWVATFDDRRYLWNK
jgi:uncharacterized membrane protein